MVGLYKSRKRAKTDATEQKGKQTSSIVKKRDKITSLPEDLWIENILTRLPARTLARCGLVSKLWYNSIYKDTRFTAIHYVQNKNKLSLIFNVLNVFRDGCHRSYLYSLEDKDNDAFHLDPKFLGRVIAEAIFELVGYCNGLACIKLAKPDAAVGFIIVINPITSETLTLFYASPTGGYMYLCHGFGFDSLLQVYKAVIVYTSKHNDKFLCMVITLGTSEVRKITTTMAEISRPPGSSPFPSGMVTRVSRTFCRQATFCGSDLYWRTTSIVSNDSKIEMLLSFNLHNEKIQFIQLPTRTTTANGSKYLVVDHLLEFKGYPCIALSEKVMISNSDHHSHRCGYRRDSDCCCCCEVHMYILKDKVKQVWMREETFDVQIKDKEGVLPAPLCCSFGRGAVKPPTRILTLSDQVLLYWFTGKCLILYNLVEKHLKVVQCSLSYPKIFRTKMNRIVGRIICDDNNINRPYMDYQLHAQVENFVSLKTFIPKGAETIKYDCFDDMERTIIGKQLTEWVPKDSKRVAGWVTKGDSTCYVFF